jgi:hypothetical protein
MDIKPLSAGQKPKSKESNKLLDFCPIHLSTGQKIKPH